MKKFLAMLMAVAMVFSIVTIPVIAEPEDSTSDKAEASQPVAPQDAATLDEALNVAGGTLTFVTEGDYPWVVDGDAAKSTNVNVASSTSTVSTTVTAADGDILQFDFQSHGEGTSTVWDGLQLFIDGTKVIEWSIVENWTTYSTALTAGEHEIQWTYKKDGSVDKPGDYATVDNVYVGEPVHPSSVQVEDVTVPANRTATVQYTVLPAEAYNKEVTFATADETIATVDANGRVRGVAEGTTTITVTTVDGGVSGSATVTVTEALPTVDLLGYIAYDPNNTSNTGCWGAFADYDPATITNLGSAIDTFAATNAGDTIYGFNYANDGADTRYFIMSADDIGNPSYTGVSAGRTVVAMAFDYTSNEMYAVAANDASGRSLYSVDRGLGTLTEIGAFGGTDTIMTLAIDENGVAYAISYEGNLYTVNLQTAALSLVGFTGVTMKYVQSIAYDQTTHQLYWAQYNENGADNLYLVDTNTAAVTALGHIGIADGAGCEVTGLMVLNNIEVPDPVMPDFTVTFVDGLDNSTISSITVAAGTVLNESDFPTPPTHEGYEFTGWNYNGSAIYADTTIKAQYRDPNATTATIIFEAEDVWGDGSGYQMLLDADANAYGNVFPVTGPLTTGGNAPAGVYDEFEYKIPVNADGNLNTSNVVCGDSVTIEIPAGIYDWCIANPTPGDRIWIAADQGNVGGRADDYEFVGGNTYHFHVYLLGQNDATDVEITGGGVTPAPTTPAPITPAPTTPGPVGEGWYFEEDPVAQGWTMVDQDGDGANWQWMYNVEMNIYEGLGMMNSQSYINYVGPLTPDNWLITPEFVAGNAISFYMAGQDPDYAAEPIGVYVSMDGGATWGDELGYFVGTGEYVQHSVDTSAYAGQNIKVAFRHYDVTDMFSVNIDAVEIAGGGDVTPAPTTPAPETPVPGDVAIFEAATVNANVGDEVVVPVVLHNYEGNAHVLNMQINYNTNALAVTGVDNGEFLTGATGAMVIVDYTTIPGSIRIGLGCPTNPAPAGGNPITIVNVHFTVLEGANNASNTVELNVTEFKNFPVGGISTNIEFVSNNGAVVVGTPVNTPVPPTATPVPPTDTPAPGGDVTIILEAEDVWGDGSGYQMLLDADATAYGSVFPAEGPLTTSGNAPAGVYDEFEYKIPVNADGNLNTSNIVCGDSVTITIPAGTYDWCITNPTPGDRIWIASAQGNVGGRANDYTFEAGKTYHFHVYLLGQNDATDVEITNGGVTPPPTTDTPAPTTPGPVGDGWFFEEDPVAQGWTMVDQDGDGANWQWMYNVEMNIYEGLGMMNSQSYINYVGPLTPDNWLITPEFVAGNAISFYMAGQDPDYAAEPIGVYVSMDGGATWGDELGYFVGTGEYVQHSVDTSDYAGMNIKVAFRHYDVTDMFSVNLDAVEIVGGGNVTPPPTTPVPPTATPVPPTDTPAPGGDVTIILEAEDVWGDGSGYQMLLDADATAYGSVFPAEGPLTTSGNAPAGVYDEFEYKIPVNADGNLNTSNIVCGDSVTITIPAGTYDWCITNPTPGDRIWIASAQGNVGGRANDYTFEAGKTYHFHVYLLGQNDATDVEITNGGVTPPPTTDTPAPTTPDPVGDGWFFEEDPVAQGWTMVDQDGDGANWQWMYNVEMNIYEGLGMMNSQSYINYVGPLTPDNWLITPEFVAGNAISFYMAGQDPDYAAEPIGVYVSMDGGATWGDELGYFVGTGEYVQHSVDTSDYAGMNIKVAFRHYDVTDMFSVNLDAVEIVGGGNVTPPPTTPVPPTDTPVPPTDTPVPPTDTPEPPTDTPEPPTDTPEPITPNPDDVIFTVPTVYGMPGETVTVPVTVEGEFQVHAMQIRLVYDPAVLTFTSVEDGGEAMFGKATVICENAIDDQGASVRLGVFSVTETMSTEGTLFTVTFTINEGVEEGTVAPLAIDRDHFEFCYMPLDGESFDYPAFFYDGAVVVGSEPPVTEPPVTDEPITDEPTVPPTDEPNPPVTGTIALVGVGIAAVLAGAGVVLFRKKED